MKNILICYLPFLFCWAASVTSSYAQPKQLPDNTYLQEEHLPRPFPDNSWNEATKGLRYTLKPQKTDRSENSEKQASGQPSQREKWKKFIGAAEKVFKILALGILIALIAFVLVQLIKRPRNKQLANRESAFSPITDDQLPNFGLDGHIREAETSGDFGAAVRFRYLCILQALERGMWIKWRKEKTNREYAGDLKKAPFKEIFYLATQVFDRVRYGAYLPEEKQYQQEIVPLFSLLQEQIEKSMPFESDSPTPSYRQHD